MFLIFDYMSNFVAKYQPNLMFIHFDSIDEAGHHYTWGSSEYYDAVKVGRGYICITTRCLQVPSDFILRMLIATLEKL